MTVHMQHPDNPGRTLCGLTINSDWTKSLVVSYGSPLSNCETCQRLYLTNMTVVDI